MEVSVAVLRPKQASLPYGEFQLGFYEILLIETKVPRVDKILAVRQLPATNILHEDEPSDALRSFLFRFTGAEKGGLRGGQAVLVPPLASESTEDGNSSARATLFCVAVTFKDKLNREYMSSLPSQPQFYNLDTVLSTLEANTVPYISQTRSLLYRLESWLVERHSMPGGFEALFPSDTPLSREKRSATNSKYIDPDNQSWGMDTTTTVLTSLSDSMCQSSLLRPPEGQAPVYGGSNGTRSQTRSRMPSNDKCDITKINPLFRSDLPYKSKVDRVVINKYYGLGKPDYSKIERPVTDTADRLGFITDTARRETALMCSRGLVMMDDYPLHRSAVIGDADGIKQLIKDGWSVTQRDSTSCTALHHAAFDGFNACFPLKLKLNWRHSPRKEWLTAGLVRSCNTKSLLFKEFKCKPTHENYGHLKALTVLLNDSNCSPNVVNDSGSTPLHLAASQGKYYAVELLLSHQDIDVSALDNVDRTALDYCESVEKPDWQASASILRFAMSQPTPKIQVSLMDGSYRVLNLVSKDNTTVKQLHRQMIKELRLPDSCSQLFAIWICSRNLQLQLKPEHKPVQHLCDWKRKIVQMLTDQNPDSEEPQLFWRRDAILSIEQEKKVRNTVAINLLYLEAYHNYIKSLYPCSETDATILAGILMYLYHGEFEATKTQPYRTNEHLLQALIPSSMLRSRSNNWLKSVIEQYKHYSRNMSRREKSNAVLQLHFLTICWNLTAYGSAFFTGYVRIKGNRSPKPVYIGVNDVGLHIIAVDTMTMWKSFQYKDIEWQHEKQANQCAILEIKVKNQSRQGSCLITKQAGLIEHLMNKLVQLSVSNVASNGGENC